MPKYKVKSRIEHGGVSYDPDAEVELSEDAAMHHGENVEAIADSTPTPTPAPSAIPAKATVKANAETEGKP